jgi:HK97 family phage prohead protease
LDHIFCPFEVKMDGDDDGTIRGYGSVFGNVDTYGDTVAKGAFTKTIADIKSGAANWPAMLSQHDQMTPIGVWTGMEENSRGLKLTGQLAPTTLGQTIYNLMKMKPRPALNGLSIGYQAKDFELHKKGQGPGGASRTLKAVDLKEISVVTFPADQFARVASVKSWQEDEPVVDEAALAKAWAFSEFEAMRRLTNHVPR